MKQRKNLDQRLQVLEQRRQETEQHAMTLPQWREWNSTGQRGQITERLSPESRLRLEQVSATMAMFGE